MDRRVQYLLGAGVCSMPRTLSVIAAKKDGQTLRLIATCLKDGRGMCSLEIRWNGVVAEDVLVDDASGICNILEPYIRELECSEDVWKVTETLD